MTKASSVPTYSFEASIWLYSGTAAWHFVTVPAQYSEEIRQFSPPSGSGFGAIKVAVRSGNVVWSTSIFPDTATGSYLLPIKKDVRRQLGVDNGDLLQLTVELQNV